MIPIDNAATAYNSIVFEESKIIGEIASNKSALPLPAYVNDKPIRAPIFKIYLFVYNFSYRMAYTGSN